MVIYSLLLYTINKKLKCKTKSTSERERVTGNASDTWQQARNLLSQAADSRTHFHNWGLKGQHKWVGIVLSWLVIRMVLLSISFIHSYNYKQGPLYASDLTHTRTHTHRQVLSHSYVYRQRTYTYYVPFHRDKHLKIATYTYVCLFFFWRILTKCVYVCFQRPILLNLPCEELDFSDLKNH